MFEGCEQNSCGRQQNIYVGQTVTVVIIVASVQFEQRHKSCDKNKELN